LKSEGQAAAIETVFKAIHEGKPDPELLAYQYVQALPLVAQSQGSSVWVIPSEVTTALRTLSQAFGENHIHTGAAGEQEAPPAEIRSVPGGDTQTRPDNPPQAA